MDITTLGMRVTRSTPWPPWLSNLVCKTAFPRLFDLTNRVNYDAVCPPEEIRNLRKTLKVAQIAKPNDVSERTVYNALVETN